MSEPPAPSRQSLQSTRTPVLFMSHGAPTFALEPGLAGPALACIGQHLPRPQAIVIVSAHWTTHGEVRATGAAQPETIHDFYGFPAALYALRYPAVGDPALAQRVVTQLQQTGWQAQVDDARGLDHGAWVPLLHLFPQADIPVVQVSLPMAGGAERAWQLGRALAPLRDAGVLIAGSGTLTHNLHDLRSPGYEVQQYVQAFTDWVRTHVAVLDHDALCHYRQRAPAAQRAHPTEEHFLPLLVAMGATDAQDPVCIVDGGVDAGVLAMDAYVFGHIHGHVMDKVHAPDALPESASSLR